MIEIQGGRIADLAAGTLEEPSTISVGSDVIECITPFSPDKGTDTPADHAVDETIDAEGTIIIPGFRNNHAHTAMTLLRGLVEDVSIEDWFNRHVWIVEQNLTPEDVYWGTLLGSLEMLHAGVTFVSDHYFHMDRAFEAYRASGMRANLAWATFGVGENVDAQFDRAVEFARSYRIEADTITTALGPHSPYLCPPEALRKSAETAQREELPLHIHVSETRDQVERSYKEHGKSPVALLAETEILSPNTMLAHAYYAGDDDLVLISRHGSAIAHCPKTFMKFGFMSDILPRALRMNIPVTLGSDGAASNNTMSICEAARDAALLAKCATGDAHVATVSQLLSLLSPASPLASLPAQTRVRTGDPPDLLLLRPRQPHLMPSQNFTSHVLYSLRESDIETVIVGGKVVIDNGVHRWIDEDEVMRHATEIFQRLSVHKTDRPMQTF